MTAKSKLDVNVKEFVAILDFGSQYNQLIARRVRECNVYCEIFPCTISIEDLMARKPKAIIFSGGPDSVYNEEAPTVDPAIFKLGVPILGICYGMQLMAKMLGGKVESSDRREYGRTELHIVKHGVLFGTLNPQLMCWMSHGDIVAAPPPGFTMLAQTKNSPVAAMANDADRQYAVQFHPEVVHTPWGIEIIRNFLFKVCECGAFWTMGSYLDQTVKQIKDRVGKRPVLVALSGGVDSAATAVMVHRAVKNHLTCIFVDHGFLRAGEPEQVAKTFRDTFKMKFIGVEASQRFLKVLRGVTDPEKKRRIIGKEFIRVFEDESEKLGRMDFLAQGTLYPDVIESHSSGTGRSATIKSHHNVGGLPKDMHFELIEPLRYLFKDEVRALCTELGIPKEITWRQPFPGPGLAIRIIGDVTQERLDILKHADSIIMEEVRAANLEYEIWQTFAVLPAIKSVGVMGDQRTYAYPIVLRAVTSEDGMTADWVRLPYDLLERISNRVVSEVPNVNRLVYDISTKPPSTIEWE